MQQKVTVTLMFYSQHVLGIHGHHRVSVSMLNCVGNSWVAAQLVASQEGLSSMKLVMGILLECCAEAQPFCYVQMLCWLQHFHLKPSNSCCHGETSSGSHTVVVFWMYNVQNIWSHYVFSVLLPYVECLNSLLSLEHSNSEKSCRIIYKDWSSHKSWFITLSPNYMFNVCKDVQYYAELQNHVGNVHRVFLQLSVVWKTDTVSVYHMYQN
jgi:hypothetical protein